MKNELTEIGGKSYMKCRVVMLPTETASRIGLNPHGIYMYYIVPVRTEHSQHLYICSQEEIKIGDWFYWYDSDGESKYVLQCTSISKDTIRTYYEAHSVHGIGDWSEDYAKKIIASTDPALELPRPSDEFLRRYCENQGIDDVLLELVQNYNHDISIYPDVFSLKVAPDNTVTIRPIKDSWNREKVKAVLHAYREYVWRNGATLKDLETWINQNL